VVFENIVQNAIVYVCFAVSLPSLLGQPAAPKLRFNVDPTLSDLQTRKQEPTIGQLLLLLQIDRKSGFLGYFFV
jgi:hypothetical protein